MVYINLTIISFTDLHLDDLVVRREDVSVCGSRSSERQYSKLGSIDIARFCCFVCVDSNIGMIVLGLSLCYLCVCIFHITMSQFCLGVCRHSNARLRVITFGSSINF